MITRWGGKFWFWLISAALLAANYYLLANPPYWH